MMKIPFISNTIRKIAIWNAAIMFGLYLSFSLFTLFILNYALIDDLDTRLRHEIDHLLHTVDITVDSLIIHNTKELEEADFQKITENPFFLQIYNLEGVLYYRSKNLENYQEILLGFPNNFSPYYFESFSAGSDELRTVYKELFDSKNNHVGYIQLSAIHSSFNEVVKNVFWFNIFTLPIVLIVISLLSVYLAKRSYHPINNIIELAKKISATNLSGRLEEADNPNDELANLIETLNSLFGRLENQVSQISQFTDNASHQLMTPLTTIKTELDYILKREHPIHEYKETCNILKSQTDRMISMVKTMLIMSRGCDVCANNKNVFNFSNLIKKEVAKIYSQSNVKFSIEENIYLRGDTEYFSIVIQNLIDNAIKYSSSDLEIEVTAKTANNHLQLTVLDRGIGISDKEKAKIFERFYRVDSDDVKKVNGYGLGLSLVKSVTEAMGGTVKVSDNKPKGSKFTITLPTINIH